MGFHGCFTHNQQGRLGGLATSTIATACMTHLLLLWGRVKKPGGSREEHMQGHTDRALFSKRSNKEACNMKAQGHAAHMSTQDGVAGAAWYCGSVQACLMTLLYICPSKALLGGRAQHVITKLAYSIDS
jgi:hypothetical protein